MNDNVTTIPLSLSSRSSDYLHNSPTPTVDSNSENITKKMALCDMAPLFTSSYSRHNQLNSHHFHLTARCTNAFNQNHAIESVIDAHATRLLRAKSPPESFVDPSLGPYVTSILRKSLKRFSTSGGCNVSGVDLSDEGKEGKEGMGHMEFSKKWSQNKFSELVPDYDSLVELLESQCQMSTDVARSTIWNIMLSVQTGEIDDQPDITYNPRLVGCSGDSQGTCVRSVMTEPRVSGRSSRSKSVGSEHDYDVNFLGKILKEAMSPNGKSLTGSQLAGNASLFGMTERKVEYPNRTAHIPFAGHQNHISTSRVRTTQPCHLAGTGGKQGSTNADSDAVALRNSHAQRHASFDDTTTDLYSHPDLHVNKEDNICSPNAVTPPPGLLSNMDNHMSVSRRNNANHAGSSTQAFSPQSWRTTLSVSSMTSLHTSSVPKPTVSTPAVTGKMPLTVLSAEHMVIDPSSPLDAGKTSNDYRYDNCFALESFDPLGGLLDDSDSEEDDCGNGESDNTLTRSDDERKQIDQVQGEIKKQASPFGVCKVSIGGDSAPTLCQNALSPRSVKPCKNIESSKLSEESANDLRHSSKKHSKNHGYGRKHQSKQEEANTLAAALFRPSRPRSNSLMEQRRSSPPLRPLSLSSSSGVLAGTGPPPGSILLPFALGDNGRSISYSPSSASCATSATSATTAATISTSPSQIASNTRPDGVAKRANLSILTTSGTDSAAIFSTTQLLLTLNSHLGHEAASLASQLTNGDLNLAQYLIEAARSDTSPGCGNHPQRRRPKICRHELHGVCYRSDCPYSHDLGAVTCLFWLRGRCRGSSSGNGKNEGPPCRFLHGFAEGLLEGICEEYLIEQKKKREEEQRLQQSSQNRKKTEESSLSVTPNAIPTANLLHCNGWATDKLSLSLPNRAHTFLSSGRGSRSCSPVFHGNCWSPSVANQ